MAASSQLTGHDRLVSLQRSAFQIAERRQVWAWRIRLFVLVLSCVAVFTASEAATHWLTVAAFVAFCAWLFVGSSATRVRSSAERARRMSLVSRVSPDASSGLDYTDVVAALETSGATVGEWDAPDYFARDSSEGPGRLVQALHESAYWSKHLFGLAASRGWLVVGVAVVGAVAVLAALPQLASRSWTIDVARAVCLVLTWLVAAGAIDAAIRFSAAEREMGRILGHLLGATGFPSDDPRVLVLLQDYNSAVQGAPIIPTAIYRQHRDRLARAWRENGG